MNPTTPPPSRRALSSAQRVALEPREQDGVVPVGLVGRAGQVEGHVLERAVAHLPWGLGVFEVGVVQLEAQAAAFGDLGRFSAVEDEIGVPLLCGDVADMMKEVLMPRGLEELLRDMDHGFWEEEGSPASIPSLVDVEEGPGKAWGFFRIVAVSLSC